MSQIYPLKFQPILVSKIWGGNKLKTLLKKESTEENIGESWEISAVKGHESVISNGAYAGKTITELISLLKSEIVGKHIYEKYQNEFPLLIKFIDANDDLSIQVHPDDALAAKKHQSKGKTEMWYVIEADENATLFSGLKKEIGRDDVIAALNDGSFTELLNMPAVKRGSTFFIPAGRIHAIRKGILLAEIQQTSDITYRLYDYDRTDSNGKKRELHIEDSLEAINYKDTGSGEALYEMEDNDFTKLAECDYFTTNLLHLNGTTHCDFTQRDSFTVLINTHGTASIKCNGMETAFNCGETILIPAALKQVEISSDDAIILETFIS